MNASPYYRPPAAMPDATPPVIRYFRLYAGMAAVGCVLLTLFLLAWTFLAPGDYLVGNIALSLAPLLPAVLHGIAAFAPRRPWAWTLGVVLLGLGIPSLALVFALPLLIFWLKPECRAAFGRF